MYALAEMLVKSRQQEMLSRAGQEAQARQVVHLRRAERRSRRAERRLTDAWRRADEARCRLTGESPMGA
jgi:hypothetical protein